MKAYDVAPARERGLKLELAIGMIPLLGRSREGAWIEIANGAGMAAVFHGRSREGAWIEI